MWARVIHGAKDIRLVVVPAFESLPAAFRDAGGGGILKVQIERPG